MKFKNISITLNENNKEVDVIYEDGSHESFVVGEDGVSDKARKILKAIYIQSEIFIPSK